MIDEIKQMAVLGGSGGGVFYALRWLVGVITGRIDRREQRLDAEHDALDMGWKEYRLFLERERRELTARVATVEKQSRAAFTAFQHVASALIRHDPQDPALLVAEKLMTAAFPTDFTMAATMAGAAVDHRGSDN